MTDDNTKKKYNLRTKKKGMDDCDDSTDYQQLVKQLYIGK